MPCSRHQFLGLNQHVVGQLKAPVIALIAAISYLGCVTITPSAQAPFCAVLAICIFALTARKRRPTFASLDAQRQHHHLPGSHDFLCCRIIYGVCGHTGSYIYGTDYNHMAIPLDRALSIATAALGIKLSAKCGLLKRISLLAFKTTMQSIKNGEEPPVDFTMR